MSKQARKAPESKATRMAREDREAASRTPAYKDGFSDYMEILGERGIVTCSAGRYDGARYCAALQRDYDAGWNAAGRKHGRFTYGEVS